ncbi:unnamed protein product [Rotaria magnacalcarata]|uniref:Uncharacterized protein n=2 Tax=Rotaria magnacalcarata TaxID=392030 RepID=A0A819SL25_9BILA|nr:unnamed protein product [Rotaria magnacalcarata]CAF4064642.1 unnamed protein product [Rotaria magnacalcarata]
MFPATFFALLLSLNLAIALNITVLPQGRSQTSCPVPYFYVRYQSLPFVQRTVSNSFVKIPGLELAVYHAQPALYRIMFQGNCQGLPGYKYVQILIDGRVLIANYLLPNTDKRQAVASELGSSTHEIDSRDGGTHLVSTEGSMISSCPRFRSVYLPSGVHIVEVGVRISNSDLAMYDGQLQVELISYDTNVRLGLEHPKIP